MRASLTALAAALLCVTAIAVTGCGLKGDLYLPENDTSTAPETTEQDDDGNDRRSQAPAG